MNTHIKDARLSSSFARRTRILEVAIGLWLGLAGTISAQETQPAATPTTEPVVSTAQTAPTSAPAVVAPVVAAPVVTPTTPAPAAQPAVVRSEPASGRPEAASIDQLPLVSMVAGRSTVVQSPVPIKRVSVTEPKVADIQVLTPMQVLISAKEIGMTDLIIWGPNEEAHSIPVSVGIDQAAIRAELGRLLPDSKLDVRLANNVVIISGQLNRTEEAESLHKFMEVSDIKYVDMSTIPGLRQVQIKVKVAEASRQAIRSLGVNVGYTDGRSFGASNVDLNQFTLIPDTNGISVFGDTAPQSAVTLFGRGFTGSTAIEAFVAALADNQYMRILAEPNLVAISGQEATFLAGGEFPIPVLQSATVGASNSITIEYKEFGVRLRFRPTVLGEGRIRLHVAPEVSQLSNGTGAVQIQGFSIPAILTRRAESTLELNNGQTFAMAGLLNQETQARSARVPGLGDLPILGTMFRSVRYQQGDTELVLLVNASLVEPESTTSDLPLPGVAHVTPDDWELYTLGRIESRRGGKVSEADSKWLSESGLNQLKGPGAWASYDTPTPTAKPQINATSEQKP